MTISNDMILSEVIQLIQKTGDDRAKGIASFPVSRSIIPISEQRSSDLRKNLLPSSWQSSVAWDMLIELMIAHQRDQKTNVKHMGIAANAPSATVNRHLTKLVEEGWVEKSPNHRDHRVINLTLSESAIAKFDEWTERRADQLKEHFSYSQ